MTAAAPAHGAPARGLARLARSEGLLALAIVLAAALVWPIGSYAIDDDWAYLRSLWRLHETGELRILDWNPMSLVAHLAWGWLFGEAFGFHFTVARLSVLALLGVECLALIALLRRMQVREGNVLLVGLALVLNPLHFFQSLLYATDVPATAWSTAALALYARGLATSQRPALGSLLLGSACAAVAGGVRQGAALVAGAPLAYLLLYERRALRDPRTWLATLLVPVVAGGAFLAWYQLVHGATPTYRASLLHVKLGLAGLAPLQAAWWAYTPLAYAAFFALPVLVALPLRAHRPGPGWQGRAALAAGAAAAALFAWSALARGFVFPYLRNRLTRFGFWSPNEALLGAPPVLWPDWAGWVVSALLAAGALALLLAWSRAPGPQAPAGARAALRLVGVAFALQLAYAFVTSPILFDRHLLPLAPLALLLAAGSAPALRLRPLAYAACLAPLAFYSVAGTHDAHAVSRAAFRAGEALVAQGIDAACIDAGYAFVGWHMYERSQEEIARGLPPRWRERGPGRAGDPWYLRVIAPRVLARYRVAFSERMDVAAWRDAVAPWARHIAFLPTLEGDRVLRRVPYRSYWPWGVRDLFVLEDPSLDGSCGAPTSGAD